MKKEYIAPEFEQILLSPAQSVAMNLEGEEGGRKDHTIASQGDIDIDFEVEL